MLHPNGLSEDLFLFNKMHDDVLAMIPNLGKVPSTLIYNSNTCCRLVSYVTRVALPRWLEFANRSDLLEEIKILPDFGFASIQMYLETKRHIMSEIFDTKVTNESVAGFIVSRVEENLKRRRMYSYLSFVTGAIPSIMAAIAVIPTDAAIVNDAVRSHATGVFPARTSEIDLLCREALKAGLVLRAVDIADSIVTRFPSFDATQNVEDQQDSINFLMKKEVYRPIVSPLNCGALDLVSLLKTVAYIT
jgi:hypothetical protein